MLSFLCKDQRDWEEPGHLKFLNALQEDAGNNFSYLIPMNIVKRGEGGNLPRGKVSPPPQPSCMPSFLCYDKWNEKSLVICSFWKLLKMSRLFSIPFIGLYFILPVPKFTIWHTISTLCLHCLPNYSLYSGIWYFNDFSRNGCQWISVFTVKLFYLFYLDYLPVIISS